MADFDAIVRPNQTRDVTPGKPVPSSDPTPPENVVLVIGENGSGKFFNASEDLRVTHYMDKIQRELRVGDELALLGGIAPPVRTGPGSP